MGRLPITHVGSKESSPTEDLTSPEGARQMGPGVDGSEGGSDDADMMDVDDVSADESNKRTRTE